MFSNIVKVIGGFCINQEKKQVIYTKHTLNKILVTLHHLYEKVWFDCDLFFSKHSMAGNNLL